MSIIQQNINIENMNENSILVNVLPLYHVFSYCNGSVQGVLTGCPNIYPGPGFNAKSAITSTEKV